MLEMLSKLKDAMTEVGYKHVRSKIYRADWSSSEVEHFIYFSLHGKQKGLFTAHFGMRNLSAELFSVNAIRIYGGEFIFQALHYDEATTCTMRFSFGRLVSPTPHWLLELTDKNWMSQLQHFVRHRLLPTISTIQSVRALLSFLAEDGEPRPWATSNCAIRAAQIVALAGLSGLDAAQTRALLTGHDKLIALGFMKSSPMRDNPQLYLDRIQADWLTEHSRMTR